MTGPGRTHHVPFGRKWFYIPASLDFPHMSTEPPPAKQVPHERTYHGDTVIDEYSWLAAKDDPDTIAYLKAENAYTEAVTAELAPLQDQIFAEIKARTQEIGRAHV